jgi:catecholate siderophore receptor
MISTPSSTRSTIWPIAGCLALTLGLSVSPVAYADTPEDHNPIIVEGLRSNTQPALGKILTTIVNTPQAISTLSRDDLDRRGVNTLSDALRVIPGISMGAGETSWQGNNVILRGFTTRNDMFLDGMRDYGYYFRDPFNSESLEVLKGPGSMLFGRGSTGGIIHQVSKLPSMMPLADISLAAGTDDTQRATLDYGTPIGSNSALRINAMGHVSSVADRDGARNRRWGLAPSVAFGLDTSTRLFLSYMHQEEHNRPDYGVPWFNGAPAKVSRDSYYGFRDDYLDTTVNIGTARFEHDVTQHIMLRSQLRYSHDTRAFRTSEAVIPANTPADTPLQNISVNRNEFSGFSKDQFLQSQTDMTIRVATGAIKHSIVAGIELGREMPRPTYIFHQGVITTSLVNPPEQSFAEAGSYVRLRARTRADTLGLYALDSIAFGDRWMAIAGMRWDRFNAHYQSTGYTNAGTIAATTSSDRTDEKASLRGAIIYKPAAAASVYMSYADSFNPSAEGIESLVSAGRSVAQANVSADPEKGRIVELGSKWGLFGSRLLLTGSLFQITKTNVRIPDPLIANANINGGRQRVRGAELEAVGQITGQWSVRTSYSFLDSETTHSDNPAAGGSPRIGEALPIAPRHSAVFQTDYAISDRLAVGGGATYQSSRLGQNTNTSLLRAPGYTIFEARARYRLLDTLIVQANVYNLTDKFYYDQLHPFHVVPGAGRSALLTLVWKG